MRVLFCMGEKSADGRVFVRPSARCIAIEGDRVAMVHSLQYDYYKFPGGGIEPQETREQALVRETQEEAGNRSEPDGGPRSQKSEYARAGGTGAGNFAAGRLFFHKGIGGQRWKCVSEGQSRATKKHLR